MKALAVGLHASCWLRWNVMNVPRSRGERIELPYDGRHFPSSCACLPGAHSHHPSCELHPALVREPADLVVVKRQSSPLHPAAGTDLDRTLRARGLDTVIVTNGCCDCAARDACQYGFEVILASQATVAMSDEEHNAALLGLELYYARVLDNAEIAALLRSD